jgi:hypothetical protein
MPGSRLVPIRPFVLGGGFELENFHVLSELAAMRFRIDLYNQMKDTPDGSSVQLVLAD